MKKFKLLFYFIICFFFIKNVSAAAPTASISVSSSSVRIAGNVFDQDRTIYCKSDKEDYHAQYTIEEMQDETITILGKVTAKIAGV